MGDIKFGTIPLRILFVNKFIVIIGGSVMRSVYKDLVLLLEEERLLSSNELKTKGEDSFLGDKLIEGGVQTNGKEYKEVREYKQPYILVRFYFVTRVFYSYTETILADLFLEKPDVLIMNSCLWDITRYGPSSTDTYLTNLEKLCYCVKRLLGDETLVIWTTAPPVSNGIKGGFLLENIAFLREVLRLDLMAANFYAHQIMVRNKINVLDLHHILANKLHMRVSDGIHWNNIAHRMMTNHIIEHICNSLKIDIPKHCRACPPSVLKSMNFQGFQNQSMGFVNESQNFDSFNSGLHNPQFMRSFDSFESNANCRPSTDRPFQFNQRFHDNMEFPMNVEIPMNMEFSGFQGNSELQRFPCNVKVGQAGQMFSNPTVDFTMDDLDIDHIEWGVSFAPKNLPLHSSKNGVGYEQCLQQGVGFKPKNPQFRPTINGYGNDESSRQNFANNSRPLLGQPLGPIRALYGRQHRLKPY